MSMRWYLTSCSVLLLLTSASCSGGDDSNGADGSGGSVGTGGAVSTGAAEPKPVPVITPDPGTATLTLADAETDHEKIQGCWSKTACPKSFAQMDNDFYTKIQQANAMCVTLGLSARTAGLYVHYIADNSARGMDSTEHAFLVLGDGTVVHTSKHTTSGGEFDLQGTAGVTYTDAERCELADSTYFDACRAAAEVAEAPGLQDLGWTCLFYDVPTAWLTNCQPTEAACE